MTATTLIEFKVVLVSKCTRLKRSALLRLLRFRFCPNATGFGGSKSLKSQVTTPENIYTVAVVTTHLISIYIKNFSLLIFRDFNFFIFSTYICPMTCNTVTGMGRRNLSV